MYLLPTFKKKWANCSPSHWTCMHRSVHISVCKELTKYLKIYSCNLLNSSKTCYFKQSCSLTYSLWVFLWKQDCLSPVHTCLFDPFILSSNFYSLFSQLVKNATSLPSPVPLETESREIMAKRLNTAAWHTKKPKTTMQRQEGMWCKLIYPFSF